MTFISKCHINLLIDIWVWYLRRIFEKDTEINNSARFWGSIQTNEKSETYADNQYKYVWGANICSHMLSVVNILSHLACTCKVVGITIIVGEEIVVQRKLVTKVTQLVGRKAQIYIQVYNRKTSFFQGNSGDRLFIPTRRISRFSGAAFDVSNST